MTVEKKEGTRNHRGVRLHVVDLPGIYSLTPYTVEEVVARDFLIEERPDVVVDVVDASNLERNLYLATELIALREPLILVLNMSDEAERRGFAIDARRLGELLGARVVRTVGHRNRGTEELLDAILEVADGRDAPRAVEIRFGREIDEELAKLVPLIEAAPELARHYEPRWVAVKLLEDDTLVREQVERTAANAGELLGAAAASRRHLQGIFGESPEIVLADRRYGFISGACQEAVVRTAEERHSRSDRIDAVVLHRAFGLPIFLLLMYLTFQFTFAVGHAPTDWIEAFFGWLSQTLGSLWPKASESPLRALLCDGILAGAGGVLAFVPYIMLLFLAIAFLEDTGYMARAAFLMDRVMHRIGLHGKSFIPMLIGFGCSVPAIMATRTLDTRRDRLTTMLVVPLMSCSARFVIYSVIVGAFFADRVVADLGLLTLRLQPLMYLLIYLVGVLLAVAVAKLLRTTVLRGETTPLVMELPPYRMPTLRGLAIHMWERGCLYLRKAGTVILGLSIVLWVLTTYPKKTTFDQDYAGRRARAEQEHQAGMARLAGPLGISGEAARLAELAEAELRLRAAAERHHPWERGYKNAWESRNTAEEALRGGPAGERIARFLDARDEIERIGREFDAAATGYAGDESPLPPGEGRVRGTSGPRASTRVPHPTPLPKGEGEWVARRDQRLAEVESRDKAAYAAAVAFHEEVLRPFEAEVQAIEHERAAERLAYSLAGRLGHAIEPALKPLGFDWRIGTAIIGAFAAKEAFVAQLGIVYAVGAGEANREALRQHLQHDYSPLTGFCIMLFCLVSTPCASTIVMTRRESGGWRWALLQLVGLTLLAYLLTLIAYQTGRLLNLGTC